MKRGNVPTQSWIGKSAVFLMESTLMSHGSSKSNKKPSDGRGISDYSSANLYENLPLKNFLLCLSVCDSDTGWVLCGLRVKPEGVEIIRFRDFQTTDKK